MYQQNPQENEQGDFPFTFEYQSEKMPFLDLNGYIS